jgi:hypothetical protein
MAAEKESSVEKHFAEPGMECSEDAGVRLVLRRIENRERFNAALERLSRERGWSRAER